ncbi:polyprenyl diphosphate synthase [Actinocatenispora rupis]|uniref:Isoprenyl transferase n=1 Tax=Actinocatenispora rupis TaxID=519421 RepID=A0A8J3JG64_9ACTN|nr:polyprenyl diphosphate synthase [Actinocatenispora rupis]GID16104.1 isoprenyl transferase [Actinocatenispora rupis]
MFLRGLAYRWYERRLRASLAGGPLPRHVGLIMDGNRRWAREMGFTNVSVGHQHGADHVDEVLDWCAGLGVDHVTIFVASTENLTNRPDAELRFLTTALERTVTRRVARADNAWRLRIAGRLDLLPDTTAHALKVAADQSPADGPCLTVAIGYGGRQELVDAFRSLLADAANAGTTPAELAETVTADDIAAHLYTAGLPDPDLVIRTSGEQRLSGFLLWQSAYSELYFCDVYWPAFRHVDFLRALRSYAARQRRFGG